MSGIQLNLDEKVVLVSGSTGGIGREIALACAEHGADVIVNGRSGESGRKLVSEIEEMGVEVAFAQADMTEWNAVDRAVQTAVSDLGGLDVLITSGGARSGPIADFFHESDPETFMEFPMAHYVSRLYFIKACLEYLQQADEARIINITSDAGRVPTPGEYGPGGQAAALMLATRVLASEFSRWDITVNSVALTVIEDTELLEWLDENSPIASIFETARERQDFEVTPSDVAEVITYLAGSDGARPITGQTISITGGVSF